MHLNDRQRRLLESADSDGRVFVGRRPDRETRELIEEGYLEQNDYCSDYYWRRKTADESEKKR